MRFVTSIVIALILVVSLYMASQESAASPAHSLGRGEMDRLIGGTTYNDSCCVIMPACNPGQTTTCGGTQQAPTTQMQCLNGQYDRQWFAGNKDICIVNTTAYAGKTCDDDPANLHKCFESWGCIWDTSAMPHACVITMSIHSQTDITDTCTDSMGCP